MAVKYDKLRELISTRGIKESELSTYVGISRNFVTRIRKNEYVSLESIEKICRSFDCSMDDILEISYVETEENAENEAIIKTVLQKCFEVENMDELGLYVSVTMTCPSYIRKINNEYRNIDKETDVLSFPMFEKNEIDQIVSSKTNMRRDVLGDIVVSVDRVKEQAVEYGHSFERELAYMIVHGFYHLMGYDHMTDDEKSVMRAKEENVLEKLKITR